MYARKLNLYSLKDLGRLDLKRTEKMMTNNMALSIGKKYTDFAPDIENYTFSMLDYAVKKQLTSVESVEQFQMSLMGVLSEKVIKYTKGKSASVKTDTGIDLYLGLVFSMDMYFRGFQTVEEAFGILLTLDARAFYKVGSECLPQLFERLKLAYDYLKHTLLPLNIDAYNDTIFSGIQLFFDTYDMEYMPHINTGMIDYPIFYDKMDDKGISYMQRYIKGLTIENEFLLNYSEEDVRMIVSKYALNYGLDASELMDNIPEIILKQSIIALILGRDAEDICFKMDDMTTLKTLISSEDNVETLFKSAFDAAVLERANYFSKGYEKLLNQFVQSIRANALENYMVCI